MKVFVTGGAGYIGSHTLVELLKQGHQVCVFDNFSNSSPTALRRVKQITNSDFSQDEGDIRDEAALSQAMAEFSPDMVVHFAGLKAVGESNALPLKYYDHNVCGSVALLKAMDTAGCNHIVFSSSATVYGEVQYLPCDEKHPLGPINPYGRTKLMVEEIIRDWAKADKSKSAILLRYFNPVGAHPSGLIGEDPKDIPNNIMPLILQAAAGKFAELSVFGGDYETRDGSGERDYIHVVDLARAHLAAIEFAKNNRTCKAINIGTGSGITVLELINTYEKISGQKVPFRIVERRAGDVGASVASAAKAANLLAWNAEFSVEDMCRSALNWQTKNPNGYEL